MQNPTRITVRTGDFDTLVHECGATDAEPLVLLHGSGPGANALSNWMHALPYFGARYRVLAPDLAGFGNSRHPDPPQGAAAWIGVWTAQILSVLDQLNVGRAHIVGNSMGGGVTLQLLRRDPQRFDRVVLMGAVGAPFAATEGLRRGWGYYRNATPEELEWLVRKFLHDPAVLGGDVRRIAQERHALVMQDHVRRQFESMFPQDAQDHIDAFVVPDAELRRLSHRTLLVHGREDFFIPLQASLYLATRIPKADLHVFPHCGHWIQIERQQVFNQLVMDFLDGRYA